MFTNTIASLLESADNDRAGLTIPSCTLNTVRLPNGNVAVLSYDSRRVAEVSPSGDVKVYEGHRGVSKTTENHINRVLDHFDDSRLVRLSSNPFDGSVPETMQYAGNYVGDYESMSPVESQAHESVRTTMKRRLKSRS